ncbi:MAG: hypothetical protein U0Q21_03505 [Dermatophilaceae bacterium]
MVRNDGSVQFGLEPEGGIRLVGLSSDEVAWLAALDGNRDPTDSAGEARISPGRVDVILTTLTREGVLLPPPEPGQTWRFHGRSFEHEVAGAGRAAEIGDARAAVLARAQACVRVLGRGALASTLADILRQSGVGDVDRDPLDATSLRRRRRPTIVVLTTAGPLAEGSGEAWRARGIPHLPVTITPARVAVGPLVVPGRGPCLACLDRVRCDLDPSWVWLREQAHAPDTVAEGESALTAVGAGLAARMALAHLDGYPVPVGVGFEVATPWPDPVARQWPAHPDCVACRPMTLRPVTMMA